VTPKAKFRDLDTPEGKFRDSEIQCSKFGDLNNISCQVQGQPVNFSLIRPPKLLDRVKAALQERPPGNQLTLVSDEATQNLKDCIGV
jgi:hypothetical protein